MARKTLIAFFALCALGFSTAHAQADLGFKAAGVRMGFVGPEPVDATFGFGIFGDFGTIIPQLALEGYTDIWWQSETAFGVETSLRDIAIGARTKYMFPVSNPKVHPYVGGGLGIHFIHSEVDGTIDFGGIPVSLNASDDTVKLGLDLGVGVTTNVSPQTDLLAEMWYGIVSDVNQWQVKVGAAYRFN